MKNKISLIYSKIIEKRNRIIYKISPIILSKILFREEFKRKLDLENPKTFNEKIMWLKLFYCRKNENVKNCINKYTVREFIKKKGLENILVKLYGLYNTPKEINFEELPNSFVFKSTTGSGNNIIVKNKDEINIEEIQNTINKWKKEKYEEKYGEVQYKGIDNKIICEEYLGDNLIDYKFFCFNGEPKFIYISKGLGKKENMYIEYLDMDFKALGIKREGYNKFHDYKKPHNYNKLVECAIKLSRDFPFVRVDLYDINGKIYFSELTFVPTGGLMKIEPEKYDYEWGDYLNIDLIKNKYNIQIK